MVELQVLRERDAVRFLCALPTDPTLDDVQAHSLRIALLRRSVATPTRSERDDALAILERDDSVRRQIAQLAVAGSALVPSRCTIQTAASAERRELRPVASVRSGKRGTDGAVFDVGRRCATVAPRAFGVGQQAELLDEDRVSHLRHL